VPVGAFVVVAVIAAVVAGFAPAAHKRTTAAQATARPFAVPTTITVTAGKPSELAFKLSKTSMVKPGAITFNVTNQGVAFHDFRICSKPVTSASVVTNSCSGKTTKVLHHGDSATLTVTISKSGKYEFLCTVSGHAAAGMKGLIGIGVAVSGSEEKSAAAAGSSSNTSGSSSGTTTSSSGGGGTSTAATTTRPGSGAGGGNASGCPPGVTIPTSGNADADGDEAGTEVDDNDGCV
jgi:uncharacterized cupredoxin-like copper-binding protein